SSQIIKNNKKLNEKIKKWIKGYLEYLKQYQDTIKSKLVNENQIIDFLKHNSMLRKNKKINR
ncbi:DUF2972 domain-containing protein, partial [Campylobacter volucris]|nr:DUF2972 domain-containing protein [Campylobacter volucris]